MKFRTEYLSGKSNISLDPSLPVIFAGSCFSQNMAAKMTEHSWEAYNPLGTLYNPLSICLAIDLILDKINGLKRFEETLFLSEGIWKTWCFDSSFSSLKREDCIEEFKIRQELFLENLTKGKQLTITFGTSICYFLSESKEPVGNCHKERADLFYRKRLSISEIKARWSELIVKLQNIFPGIKLIFTVSPVRHLKDGFEGNSRSKAILLLAIEEILASHQNCDYFPAYEILNDDLRDYRFYASDLVHPSEEGIEYIWEKFVDTYLTPEGKSIIREGNKKFKAGNHRPKTGALGKPLIY